MDQLDKIFFVIALLVAGVFLKKMFKNAAQLAGIIMIVVFGFLIYSGQANYLVDPKLETVFQNNNIRDMQIRYCSGSSNKREKAVCNCVIHPVYDQLHKDFSQREIEEIEANQEYLSYEISRIIDKKRPYIQDCLESSGAGSYNILQKFRKSRDIWDL